MRRRIGASALTALMWLGAGAAQAQTAGALDAPNAPEVVPALDLEQELPTPPHLELDASRLGAFFEDQASDERDGLILSGVMTTSLGAINLGLGLWLMLDDETFAGYDLLRGGGAALAIPTGIMAIVSGIYSLQAIGVAGDRLRRWRLAVEGGLSDRELGRFEGELRAEAEAARVLRDFEAVSSFATAGGGLALILATALSSLDESGQIYGYGFGGLFALVGLIGGLDALLSESRAEANWRAYQNGEGPDGAEAGVDLTVTPMVTEGGAGISVGGRF